MNEEEIKKLTSLSVDIAREVWKENFGSINYEAVGRIAAAIIRKF